CMLHTLFVSIYFRLLSTDIISTQLYTISLHDALPIYFLPSINNINSILSYKLNSCKWNFTLAKNSEVCYYKSRGVFMTILQELTDRKSTRLNSSHVSISYAVFC